MNVARFTLIDSKAKLASDSSRLAACTTKLRAAAPAGAWMIVLLLSDGCVEQAPQDRQGSGGDVAYSDTPDIQPPGSSFQPLCPNEECPAVTCPDGFSRVGPHGARGSFCIAQQQEPASTYLQAMTECFTMSTLDAVPHLCTMEEWYIACTQGEDLGEPSIDDMIGDSEWLSDAAGKNSAMAMGKTACANNAATKTNVKLAFRCCVR